MTKKSILKGAMIIAFASLFSRFIGLFFRIPITQWLGEEGMGLYSFPMNFFLPIIAIVTVGPSNAISRMTSEAVALEDHLEVRKLLQSSAVLMSLIGLFMTIVMIILGPILAIKIWPKDVLFPYFALAPAPLFLSLVSVLKGYYQGHQNMLPSAIQQITDGAARVIIGLGLTYLLIGKGLVYGTSAATFGTTAGAFSSLMILLLMYSFDKHKYPHIKLSISDYFFHIKKILSVSIPIVLGAIGASVIPLIDSMLINIRLTSAGFSELTILKLNGIYSNVNALVNVPTAIGVAISLSIVPNIAAAKFSKSTSPNIRFRSAMIMMISIAIPSGFGVLAVGKDVFSWLFDMSTNHYLMELSSISILFMMINQGFIAALQGMGLEKLPVKNFYFGLLVKLIFSYILLNGYFNIHGAVLSTIISYSLITFLNIRAIIKYTTFKLDVKYMIILPLMNGLIMFLTVKILKAQLILFLPNSLTIVISIITGAGIYGILLIATKIIALAHVPVIRKWFN